MNNFINNPLRSKLRVIKITRIFEKLCLHHLINANSRVVYVYMQLINANLMHNNFYSNQCFSKDKTTTSNNRTRGLILINHIHNEQQKDDKPMTGLQSLGKLDIARTLFPSTVGHIPIELSRYIWYALQRGAGIRREVKSVGYKTISACSRWSGNTY